MNATKITDEEINGLTVSSLPTRPTAPTAFGGAGYTATEIKAVFDYLPLLLTERYNTLLDDIESLGDESLAASIRTDIRPNHTLADLFSDIKGGDVAHYIPVGNRSLYSILSRLYAAVFGEELE